MEPNNPYVIFIAIRALVAIAIFLYQINDGPDYWWPEEYL